MEGSTNLFRRMATCCLLAGLAVLTRVPAASAVDPTRLMPLGDSITQGSPDSNPGKFGPGTHGAYRLYLWSRLADGCLEMDFVGGQSDGPAGFDRDHEGHGGWQIVGGTGGGLSANVDGWLAAHQPGVVLLMIGTNDVHGKTAAQLLVELDALIDQILSGLPEDGRLLVASIPRQTGNWAGYNTRVVTYNAGMPDIVAAKVAQGHDVSYVEIYDLLLESDIHTDGLHPNESGYRKMADAWYDALAARESAPVIAEVSPDPDTLWAGEEYIRPLRLVRGFPPASWSIVQAPPDARLDAGCTLAGWTPTPQWVGSIAVFEVEAVNALGADTETWQVKVRSRADFDLDDDVDQADFGFFQTCISGSGAGYDPGCAAADLHADGLVDGHDFDLFQSCMGGANRPPGC